MVINNWPDVILVEKSINNSFPTVATHNTYNIVQQLWRLWIIQVKKNTIIGNNFITIYLTDSAYLIDSIINNFILSLVILKYNMYYLLCVKILYTHILLVFCVWSENTIKMCVFKFESNSVNNSMYCPIIQPS